MAFWDRFRASYFHALTTQTLGSGAAHYDIPPQQTCGPWSWLSCCGPILEGDCGARGCYRGIAFDYAIAVKVFATERDRRIGSRSFDASILTLPELRWPGGELFACTGRPFGRPRGDGWVQNGNCRGLAVWVRGEFVNVLQEEKLDALLRWVDNSFAAFVSCRYALYAGAHGIRVLLWDPESNSYQWDIECLRDALDALPVL